MKLNKKYVVRKIGADYFAVAVSEDAGQQMIKLNETASFLFELCLKDFTAESLVDALLANYEVTREQAEKDVAAFLLILKKNNLI